MVAVMLVARQAAENSSSQYAFISFHMVNLLFGIMAVRPLNFFEHIQ